MERRPPCEVKMVRKKHVDGRDEGRTTLLFWQQTGEAEHWL